jgi:hypothetical protein
LATAGVDLYANWERYPEESFEIMSVAEDVNRMEKRNQSLAMLRDKKYLRRAGEASYGVKSPCAVLRESPTDALNVDAASSATCAKMVSGC